MAEPGGQEDFQIPRLETGKLEKRKFSTIFKCCLDGEMSPKEVFREILGLKNEEKSVYEQSKTLAEKLMKTKNPGDQLCQNVWNLIQQEPDWCAKYNSDLETSYYFGSIIRKLLKSPSVGGDSRLNEFLVTTIQENHVLEKLTKEIDGEVKEELLKKQTLNGQLLEITAEHNGPLRRWAIDATKLNLKNMTAVGKVTEGLNKNNIDKAGDLTERYLRTIFKNGSTDDIYEAIEQVDSWLTTPETKNLGLKSLQAVFQTSKFIKHIPPQTELKLARSLINTTGLDYDDIIWAWTNPKEDVVRKKTLSDNIRVCINLELAQPGICKFLFDEYGIATFGKYPQEILLKQYKEKDNTREPFGILLSSWYDWNGALSDNQYEIKDIFEKMQSLGYGLKVIEISTELSMVRSLNRFRHKFGKASYAFINLHGNPGVMGFGDKYKKRHVKFTDFRKKGYQALRLAFKENSPIIFSSCETGVKNGIGQEISKLGLDVVSPSVGVRETQIKAKKDRYGNLKFNVKYNPSDSFFKDLFRFKKTRRYIDGKAVWI